MARAWQEHRKNVAKTWQEPGINNEGIDDDPYIETTPENMLEYLENVDTEKMKNYMKDIS